MSSIKSFLFSLLRNALWCSEEELPKGLSQDVAKQLFRVAKEQTVIGCVADALIRNDVKMPQNDVFDALFLLAQIQRTNHQLNEELKAIVKLKIDKYVVVKGQTVATLYPNPLLRMSGDIDFLVSDYSIAYQILKDNWSVSLPDNVIDREVAFEHGDHIYELHTSLLVFAKKKHQAIWDELIKQEWNSIHEVEIEGTKVRTLSPTVNTVYVFIHIFFHFIREGISLRQFCDWAMVLHYYKNEIDKDFLLEILLDLDMFDAYCAFGTILVDNLGLPKNEFPFVLDNKDRKWKDKILDDIFRGGNFGKLNHQTNSSWRFKLETMRIAVRNSYKYYNLCPSEVGGMIPKLMKGNVKIWIS